MGDAYSHTTVVNGNTYYYVLTASDTSANESVDSNEAEATPNSRVPGALHYLSFTGSTDVPGTGTVRDEDIVVYYATAGMWVLHFDGSDVGAAGSDVNALSVLANDDVL